MSDFIIKLFQISFLFSFHYLDLIYSVQKQAFLKLQNPLLHFQGSSIGTDNEMWCRVSTTLIATQS